MAKKHPLPSWALKTAEPGDRLDAARAHSRGLLKTNRDAAFVTRMLGSDESFDLALAESGVEVCFPRRESALSANDLKKLDDLYDERSADGRPTRWGWLVEELRDIRRAVEAGVVVTVEGKALSSFQSFYDWAHGRYHMLEDGYDSWIGDDDS
jgi:hypothetical protein